MRKVITYGTFDLLHQGHINILRRAKELGDYLIVGVTSDHFDQERGKLNTHDDVVTRIEAVKNTGFADKIILEDHIGQKVEDILQYGVDVFAIGSDWQGEFDYLKDICEVVYLPRTEGISSTMIRNEKVLRIGVIGTGSIARRFIPESKHISCVSISAAYNPDLSKAEQFCNDNGIELCAKDCDELFGHCDAVYVASPHYTHYSYVKAAINAGKHVLCETPFVLATGEAKELAELALKKGVTVMVAHKTAYCPAFRQLIAMLKSGAIGDIVDINASATTITPEDSHKMDSKLHGGSMNENACFPALPIIKLLGTGYKNINFYSKIKNDVDIYTKAVFLYDSATASFQVGLGAKTEGNLVVAGTNGYAYVPAPWWKTDYFELRFEDTRMNKRFFTQFQGEGLRYEIREFVNRIQFGEQSSMALSLQELVAMADIQERYINRINLFNLN